MTPTHLLSTISSQVACSAKQVAATITLLDEGSTVPFIARYRKEATGGLDEVLIEKIRLATLKYRELEKRKEYILASILEQGKLTPELEAKIKDCTDSNFLEDLYLPFKPKRKTKASIARENGLEPLAQWLMKETYQDVFKEATRFVKNKINTEEEALQGARDIIAEWINEDARARASIRLEFERHAEVYSKVAKGKEVEGQKFQDYFSFSEPLKKCPSHRILALFRGEEEGFLKIGIEPEEEFTLEKLERQFITRKTDSAQHIALAVKDSYKRLLAPSIETEFRNLAKAKADEEAIHVFAENLRQLLLSAPLGSKRILAIDPGFRSGCKVVCLNQEGDLIHDTVIYPHEPQRELSKAIDTLKKLVQTYHIQAIAIGNGTAGRETEEVVKSIDFGTSLDVFLVNESGASIYSASDIAREEFPDKDLTVRGAVSIGRRLADPLAELVKIDAKSIGVGQYQHDVDQNKLKQSLDTVVQSCVNKVGVNLNTASKSLLTYVSGLGPQTAQNIIAFRNKEGAFKNRTQLKKVARLGDKAFEQCAGFLRIPNGVHPLDNSAVHPESYAIVEAMAKDQNCSVADLLNKEDIRKKIVAEKYVTSQAGLPTIQDILKELAKPGLDPREAIQAFSFANVKKPEDLYEGMIVPGIVTNITKFGCFVDIGVKQDGMVHISQLANKFVSDPNEVVRLQQQVLVKVMEVDVVRKRISLSMKQAVS
ncbi:MAG: RNA-binding transcriptional accessory protein [Bacteroidetes bacterium B1(2017)]|nr:MAG: RNA-binding transcriptional accessory protein [Bacteroidetes bacterium B1(2017)]